MIWAAGRVDISEFSNIKSQFSWKYGGKFIKDVEENKGNYLNERVVKKLEVNPPSGHIVNEYLKNIAKVTFFFTNIPSLKLTICYLISSFFDSEGIWARVEA